MEEAKLSLATRQKFESSMRTGEPLPIRKRAMSAPIKRSQNLFDMKKNDFFSKRTLQQIEGAGDYTTDAYRPMRNIVDREKEKEMLQNLMEFGEKRRIEKPKMKVSDEKTETLSRQERLDELAREIEERVQFLDDMFTLGQGKRYERDIKLQISAKLREVKELQKMSDDSFASLKIKFTTK